MGVRDGTAASDPRGLIPVGVIDGSAYCQRYLNYIRMASENFSSRGILQLEGSRGEWIR